MIHVDGSVHLLRTNCNSHTLFSFSLLIFFIAEQALYCIIHLLEDGTNSQWLFSVNGLELLYAIHVLNPFSRIPKIKKKH